MKKQASHRKYNIPDADLYLTAIERITYAKRDLPFFGQYSFDAGKLKAFLNLCEKFKALPDDDELLGDQMISTEKKYAAAEKLKSAIRSLMTRVALKFPNKSGRYRKFGTAKMGDMTDAQLLFCARRVVRVARGQMDFLSEVGINDNVLQRISLASQEFEKALNIQQDKVSDRDIAVENRIELGNKVYDQLVTLCNIGKDIWAEKDPAKYEQYALYESNNEQKKARKRKRQEQEQPSVK
jgi:hypothetical protein